MHNSFHLSIVNWGDWLWKPAHIKGPAFCFAFEVELHHHVTLTVHTFQDNMAFTIVTPQKIPGINKVIIVFSSLALGHLKHWPMICLCLSFHAFSQTDRRWHVVLWWYCCCSQMSSCQGCHFFFPAFFGFQSILLRDLGRTSQLRHTPYLHSEETLLPVQLNRLRSA